ncbi:hypothetical protein A33Q_1911 [Indibacter alkaliphilus LW1]|uniref:Uncharacterized protein n=1 Tax=Indibacter alkaliphilus (strain CCUG 57479 / KCTC 22604 / LW1) TaxID=1189612 RepID=S2E454_INDAL|nr:hypothetical protein A33Q_1911 [Indibacter alkaliphilus LW1]
MAMLGYNFMRFYFGHWGIHYRILKIRFFLRTRCTHCETEY